MNPQLVEVVNSKGMVVKHVGNWNDTSFGPANIVTIEGATHRITFITNVLNGVNYFKIFQVHDLHKDRAYRAQRYFYKYIPLISAINGETFIKLKELENN